MKKTTRTKTTTESSCKQQNAYGAKETIFALVTAQLEKGQITMKRSDYLDLLVRLNDMTQEKIDAVNVEIADEHREAVR